MLPVMLPKKVSSVMPRWFDVFDREFDGLLGSDCGVAAGRVDVWQDDKQVVVEAELPGVAKKDIEVSVDKGVLTIEADQKAEDNREGRNYSIRERRYGKVARRFRLPETVDESKIDAGLTDGVLTVKLSKKEVPSPTRIEVK